MFNFHVVLYHQDTGYFSAINYKTHHEVLTESDLINIENVYAENSKGINKVKTITISWQRLNV